MTCVPAHTQRCLSPAVVAMIAACAIFSVDATVKAQPTDSAFQYTPLEVGGGPPDEFRGLDITGGLRVALLGDTDVPFAVDEAKSGDEDSGPFAEGTRRIEPYAFALSNINDGSHANLFGAGVGVNYYIKDNVAVRGELFGTGVDQGGDNGGGAGFNLLGRWHFYERPRWRLFTEGGAGVLQTSVSLPDGSRATDDNGTNFNFSLHAGLGATYQIKQGTHLIGAFRYTHISNAGISGEDENPGLDTIGGYLGLSFRF